MSRRTGLAALFALLMLIGCAPLAAPPAQPPPQQPPPREDHGGMY